MEKDKADFFKTQILSAIKYRLFNKNLTAFAFLLYSCLILSVPPVWAQTTSSTAFTVGENVEGIREYTLKSNGLRVLLFPDASIPKVTVNITYLVGSRHEGYGETGMAHLLEHMLFKATPKHPKLWQEMNNRGFLVNGTTWLDRTNYFESFTANDDNLQWAIDVEADRMVNSSLLREELDTEMTVVRNEFEQGENNPQWALYGRVYSLAFDWHNYGNSTIGNRSDIENVGIENLRAFYKTYYQPDNAVLLIAGKFDSDKVLNWVTQSFGAIPKPTRSLPKLWTVEPAQDGEREVTVRRVGDSQMLFAVWHTPPAAHADSAALNVLAQLMTHEPTGRLYQALIKSKLAVGVKSDNEAMFDPSLTGFFVQLNKTQAIDKARYVLLNTVESAWKKPFTEAEIKRIKLRIAKDYDQVTANSGRFAVALSEAIAMGDWRFYFYQRDRIAKVTTADIERVAKIYFKPQNRTIGRFIAVEKPDRITVPEKPMLSALLQGYQGDLSLAEGEVFDVSPEKLEQRIERFTLANGMKVSLLPKRTRGNTANLSLRIGYGNEKSLAGEQAVDAIAGRLLLRGAKGLDRQQIHDKLDSLRASGDMVLNGASFQTKREHVDELIALIAQLYTMPVFSLDELEQVRKEMITTLEESAKDPEIVATTALERHFSHYPRGDARYVPTTAEQIADLKAVTRERVIRYATAMRGLSNAELTLVGDFDINSAKATLQNTLAAIKSKNPYRRVNAEYAASTVKNERLPTPDKENTLYLARVAFPLQDTATDYPALLLSDFILGGSAGGRLFLRIRENEGLSYHVFSKLSVPTYGNDANWSFGFIANPTNAAKAEASLRDELQKLINGELSEQEFDAQRKAMLDQRILRRAQDASLAAQLTTLSDADRTFAFVAKLEQNIMQLKKSDFDATLKKYLKLSEMSSFLAGDFSKLK